MFFVTENGSKPTNISKETYYSAFYLVSNARHCIHLGCRINNRAIYTYVPELRLPLLAARCRLEFNYRVTDGAVAK